MAKLPSIHLHLGAHKTATTYLQALLRRNRAKLAEAGAVYLGPERLRGPAENAFHFTDGGPVGWLVGKPRARRILTELIADEASDAMQPPHAVRCAILSEENILGSCGRIIRAGRVYTGLERRMGAFGRLVDGPRTVVCFAIRDYGDFFASAHSQLARHRRPERLTPLPANELAALPRRWPQVVRDLRRIFAEARIVVWRYEDFRALEAEVLERLIGHSFDELARPQGDRHPSLSGPAMEALLAEEEIRGGPLTPNEVRIIGDAAPLDAGHARYDPWPEAARNRFAAAYREDWAALREMSGIETLGGIGSE